MTKNSETPHQATARQEYRRIRWGEEADGRGVRARPCPDCGVDKGELHLRYCDQEQCPRCQAQAISCNCEDVLKPQRHH